MQQLLCTQRHTEAGIHSRMWLVRMASIKLPPMFDLAPKLLNDWVELAEQQ